MQIGKIFPKDEIIKYKNGDVALDKERMRLRMGRMIDRKNEDNCSKYQICIKIYG